MTPKLGVCTFLHISSEFDDGSEIYVALYCLYLHVMLTYNVSEL